MNNRSWIGTLIICGIILALPLAGIAEAESDPAEAKTDSGLEITINGVPIEQVIGAASEAIAGAVEENVNEAVDGLGEVFTEFAQGFSEGLEEVEGIVGSVIDDTWYLSIPAIGLETEIRRSTYDSALDLYEARLSGEADKESYIAKDTTEDCGNSIIYIYDDGQLSQAVLAAAENDDLREKVLFGSGYGRYEYRVLTVLYLAPSDEPFAMCNMSDLRDARKFEAFADYIAERAIYNYEMPAGSDIPLVTIIFQSEDTDGDWLTIVAQEEATMIE